MPNILILGQDGSSGGGVLDRLDVDAGNVYDTSNFATSALLAAQITNDHAGGLDEVNWIGHGNPGRLFTDHWDLTSGQAATFFDSIPQPAKVVLWSCNTGLCRATGDLNTALHDAYGEHEQAMEVEILHSTYINNRQKQYVRRVAEAMGVHGVDLFAPMLGVPPGAIARFDMAFGPGSLVRFRSGQALQYGAIDLTTKLNKIAVVWDGKYQIICSWRKVVGSNPQRDKFRYNSKYSDM